MFLIVLVLGALAFILWKETKESSLHHLLDQIYKLLRLDSTADRLVMFKTGLSDFASSPILGVGWSKGGNPQHLKDNNFYSNMYHCILIQFAASTGVLGIIAFAIHLKDFFKLAIKRARIDRILLLGVPAIILATSLVDNFFFYLDFQIIYVTFLLIAEKHFESTKNKTT